MYRWWRSDFQILRVSECERDCRRMGGDKVFDDVLLYLLPRIHPLSFSHFLAQLPVPP